MGKSASKVIMKKLIIVSPHFPPSNLAAVHRTRLFAKHLPAFGWKPIVLTVHHSHYEEKLDWKLQELVSPELQIETVNAFPTGPVRVIGDIGLRGGYHLYKKLLKLIKTERPDFIYIPIPSFYASLLGRAVNIKTGIPYGIDYIDPWVHIFAGSERMFSRHWLSTKLSGLLEPIAVKGATLITGVAEGYFKPVLERNSHLYKQSVYVAMPYGGEPEDHSALKKLNIEPYLFTSKPDKLQLVYAGAMLPKAYKPLEVIFQWLQTHEEINDIELHFIGTGSWANDETSFTIKPLAEKYNLWQSVVFEYPKRIPYLDVLAHLEASDGIFVLGSTEPHYTPSKVYQGILSQKPILAVLHSASTAGEVIEESRAGIVLKFNGESDLSTISELFADKLTLYRNYHSAFDPTRVDTSAFEQYSAFNVTKILAEYLNKAIQKSLVHE
ncbi:glycosyltransferase family protein [Pontibacter pudoricolor]|uniref:glycosyltransferase family 4 protein n=1 Tax=Pontibacter pudoricolor TaxID=2694930 RepID=UPI00139161A7|nr:glycosyltransferase family 4 protein [Pontibacter pudoricolor]